MSRSGLIGGVAVLVTAVAAALTSDPLGAAERGTGFYLLGSRGPMAGFTPPPGIFVQNDVYLYSGEAGGGIQLPFGGQVIADVEADVFLELPTGIWITPLELFGGNLGFSATVPVGSLDVDARLGLVDARRRLVPSIGDRRLGSLAVSDDIFAVGDPVLSTFLGWHAGNFHWQVGVAVNTPLGEYEEGEIANIAFNRWGTDVFATGTWLDPAVGYDVSGAVGVTFNEENPATNYETGNELHIEAAFSKYFTKDFSLGMTGYYYNQLTGDSGAGARLGGFEGEVAAIGGTLGYNFQLGNLPVSTRLKYFHEIEADNRLRGDAGFLTVSLPLWVPPPR